MLFGKKASVHVMHIMQAFELQKQDLLLEAPRVSHVIGYDYGRTWTSSDGMPWYGYRKAFIEAVTTRDSKKEITFNLEQVTKDGETVMGIATPARLIIEIEPLYGHFAEISKIKRAGKILGDKGRVEKFFDDVITWTTSFKKHPSITSVGR